MNPNPASPVVRRARWLAIACALGALTAPLLRVSNDVLPGTLAWLLGLASHWQWLYAGVGGLASLVWLVGTRRPWGLVSIGVSAACLATASPTLDTAPATGPVLVVATANLNVNNRSFGRLQTWLLSAQAPDVVFLQEFSDAAAAAVTTANVKAAYPHQLLAPAPDPFGIAILSRHPLADAVRLEPPGGLHTTRLRARIDWQGQVVHLAAMHPMPPLDNAYTRARDVALREEAAWLRSVGAPGVLAGDLNDSPWSTGLHGVQATLKRADGLAPTWPNALGGASVLPLDHVLATDHWHRVQSLVGPDLGSDHRPVVVTLGRR